MVYKNQITARKTESCEVSIKPAALLSNTESDTWSDKSKEVEDLTKVILAQWKMKANEIEGR